MLLNSLTLFLLVALGMGCGDEKDKKGPLASGNGVADTVSFVDAGLEVAVREVLEKPDGALTEEESLSLTHLDASGRQIADLTGIGRLENLAVLNLSDNQIHDIAPLSALARLCTLDLAGNKVERVEPLAELAQLQHLVLKDNAVRDLLPLLGLLSLRYVDVLGNPLDENSTAMLEMLREEGVAVTFDADVGDTSASEEKPGESEFQDFKIAYILLSPDAGTGEDIFVMRVSGMESGEPVNMTHDPAAYGQVEWSPDGTKIAFVSPHDGNMEIYVMNVDSSNLLRLTQDELDKRNPVWSPDGTKIAFHAQASGERPDIYVMDADGGNLLRLTQNEVLDALPAWSPDGMKIAFRSNRDGRLEIYIMDADGGNPVRLTQDGGGFFVWSPDGTKIAFDSYRDGEAQIYVVGADGGNLVKVTNSPVSVSSPAWSPDGTRIICTTWIQEERYQLLIVNVDELFSGAVEEGVPFPLSFDEITGSFSVAPL